MTRFFSFFLFCYYIINIIILIEEGEPFLVAWRSAVRILEETFSFSLSEWCCIFISLALMLIQKLISAPLAVNILNYLCFLEKAGLFTKFVDTFFSVCRQKSFLTYDAENGTEYKLNERIYFRYCCIFRKKGCFYWNLNYFFACKFICYIFVDK